MSDADAPKSPGSGPTPSEVSSDVVTEAPSLEAYSDTERQIFDAALSVFARKGKDGARMQEIADAASINKAMVHYYFRSKDQLYQQVFVYTMQRFMASFGAALREAGSFAETLRVFIDRYVSFVSANHDIIRLMIGENLKGGELIVEHMRPLKEHPEAPPQIMIAKIRAAIEAGEIRDVSPHHTLLTIVSGCLFPMATEPTVRLMHPDAHVDWGGFLEDRKQHLFDLIYHGLRPADAS